MPKLPPRPLKEEPKPDVRLAYFDVGGEGGATDKGLSPTVRLAHSHGAQGDNVLIGQKGVKAMPDDALPGILVSYYYLKPFLVNRHRYKFRDWVLDSGAFSAHNSGVEIKLDDYIACCKELMGSDPALKEIYSLDVIGDWRASHKNTERMWAAGIPAVPCFHAEEPWDVLKGLAKDYPKIALGGVALAKTGQKLPWVAQCFARVWPKRIHGFALCSEKAVMGFPFDSVDATNWELGPCRFGQWRAFGGQRVSVRGSHQNLKVEVEYYLELERRARVKWKRQMEELDKLEPRQQLRPTVRLAGKFSLGCHDPLGQSVTDAPQVRLAVISRDNETRASQAFGDTQGAP